MKKICIGTELCHERYGIGTVTGIENSIISKPK